MEFLRIILSCPVVEGYGATETSAAATGARLDDTGFMHVGAPFPCNEVRLDDIPEMGYTCEDVAVATQASNGTMLYNFDADAVAKARTEGSDELVSMPRGEVCLRGENVFSGYYKNKEKTDEVLDKHGWYHSGDVGMWLPNGTLRIIDRKKHIFKLAQVRQCGSQRLIRATDRPSCFPGVPIGCVYT